LRGIKKNILLKTSRTYFHFYKKGFLNSQAVRIRVNFEVAYHGHDAAYAERAHDDVACIFLLTTGTFSRFLIFLHEIYGKSPNQNLTRSAMEQYQQYGFKSEFAIIPCFHG
jgi:hypothetical protein